MTKLNPAAMFNRGNKIQVWIKLQRKIKSVNCRIEEANGQKTRSRLLRKLKILVNRLFTLNRKWRIGIAAATLLLWLGNHNIHAQNIFDHSNLDGNNGYKIVDSNTNGKLGYDIAAAGDFNGDGIQDMIISSCDNILGKSGGVYVVFGSNGGFTSVLDVLILDGTTGFFISESTDNNRTGVSVSSAGDFNGDGFDDLIVGESLHNYNSGRLYILFGNNQNQAEVNLNTLNGTNGFQINADASLGPYGRQLYFFGETVAGIGDINKDGYDDLAFSWAFQLEYGFVNILYGSGSALDPVNHVDALVASNRLSVLKAPFAIAYHGLGGDPGNDAISHGDINGDGFEDLVLGHASMNGNDGAVYAIFGNGQQLPDTLDLNTLDGQTGFQLAGYEYYGYMGVTVDVADINGDGFDDILAGTYVTGYNYYNAKTTVLFGKGADFSAVVQASDLNGSDGFEITGLNPDEDYSTVSIAAIDDVNGDGIDDVMIGVDDIMINSNDDAGQIHVIFGNDGVWPANYDINTLNGDSGFIINGTAANEQIGANVGGIGDINGDGAGDFAFAGAKGNEVFVVFGVPAGQVAFDALDPGKGFTVISDNSGWNRETAFGDFNGDGKEDFVFSSQNNDGQIVFGTNAPAAPIINLDTLNGADGFSAITNESNYDVALVDMNKDGFDDIVFGQPYAVSDRGNNYVLFGHNGMQDANVDLENPGSNDLMVMNPSQSSLMSGYYEFNVGDINGDGFDDLYSVGYYEDPSGVILFSDANLPNILDIDTDINTENGCIIHRPYPTLQTGDFNGDGKNDILTKVSSAHWAIIWGQAIKDMGFINPYLEQDNTIATKIEVWGMDAHQSELDAVLDFNNDGYDDMLFRNFTEVYRGAPGKDTLNLIYGHAMPFEAYFLDIWNRPQDALDGTDGRYITGLQAGQQISTVTTLDFNHDDYEDIIFAIEPANEVYVIYGNNSGAKTTDISNLQASQGFKIQGFVSNELTLEKGGNLNGDCFSDLIILEKNIVGFAEKVVAHIVYGQKTSNTIYNIEELQSIGGHDIAFSSQVSAIDDVNLIDYNGDGFDDVVFSIHEADRSEFKFLLSEKDPNSFEVEDIVVCSGDDYTFPDGTVETNIIANTSHESLLTSVNGCDSLITTNVQVYKINTNVSTEGNTLTAEEANADTYQWLDCDLNDSPIEGATNFAFDAPKSGDYALVIEKDGCTETSACITLVITGMEDIGNMVQRIWPNPSSGKVNIHLIENNQKLELFIHDLNGKILFRKDVAPGEANLTTELPPASGVYFIQLISNLKTATFKVIKK